MVVSPVVEKWYKLSDPLHKSVSSPCSLYLNLKVVTCFSSLKKKRGWWWSSSCRRWQAFFRALRSPQACCAWRIISRSSRSRATTMSSQQLLYGETKGGHIWCVQEYYWDLVWGHERERCKDCSSLVCSFLWHWNSLSLADLIRSFTSLPLDTTPLSPPAGPLLGLICIACQGHLMTVWLSLAVDVELSGAWQKGNQVIEIVTQIIGQGFQLFSNHFTQAIHLTWLVTSERLYPQCYLPSTLAVRRLLDASYVFYVITVPFNWNSL